jgi:hypothetical protein
MSSLGTTPRPFLPLSKTYGLLTKVQNASAYAFTTFTVIHGAQILAANVGGSRLSNHWILLGRPFYQDENLEKVLVTGSAVAHILAGLAKAGIRLYWNRNNNKSTTSKLPSTLLPYHHLAGYVLIPLAGLHYYLVRSLPIERYGDSAFIDFGYIAWGLQNKPVFTYGLHTALIIGASYHMVSGAKQLFTKKRKEQVTGTKVPQHGRSVEQKTIDGRHKKQQMIQKGLVAGLSLALISSMIIIGNDTKKIPLRLDFAKMYARII